MTEPCIQDRRITKTETLVDVVVSGLEKINEKVDQVLEKVGSLEGKMDSYEKRPYSNSFVGGVAAAGGLVGLLLWDVMKPLAKPILLALTTIIK